MKHFKVVNNIRYLLVVLGLLVFTGCSTTVVLVAQGDDFAIVQGKNVKRSLCNWAETAIHKVDGKQVAHMNGSPVKYSDFSAHISPGEHKVELMALYNVCAWPKTVIGEVIFSAEANKSYHPEMKIENDIVSMWLVDSVSGEIVSGETTPEKAKGQFIYVPL